MLNVSSGNPGCLPSSRVTCFSFNRKELSAFPCEQQSLQQTETEYKVEVLQHSLVVEASLSPGSKLQGIAVATATGSGERLYFQFHQVINYTF